MSIGLHHQASPDLCKRLSIAGERTKNASGLSPLKLMVAFFIARGQQFVSYDLLTAYEAHEALIFFEALL